MNRNYVKKYMNDFNKSSIQKDKKRQNKNGYSRYKKTYESNISERDS